MDNSALYRLLAWLSPSYPVGAFAYSHGLEWAIEAGDVHDADTLYAWVADILYDGAGRSDAILFRHAYAAAAEDDRKTLRDISDLATAFCPSAERRLETLSQGNAFLAASLEAWPWEGREDDLTALREDEAAYPIAVGLVAARHDVPLVAALHAYLHGLAANLVSAGMRAIPLGQNAGQRVIARLEPIVRDTWFKIT